MRRRGLPPASLRRFESFRRGVFLFRRNTLFDFDQAHHHAGSETMQRDLAAVRKFDAVMVKAFFQTPEGDFFHRLHAKSRLQIARKIFEQQTVAIGHANRGGAIAGRRQAETV